MVERLEPAFHARKPLLDASDTIPQVPEITSHLPDIRAHLADGLL
jgi:hypothetical protein